MKKSFGKELKVMQSSNDLQANRFLHIQAEDLLCKITLSLTIYFMYLCIFRSFYFFIFSFFFVPTSKAAHEYRGTFAKFINLQTGGGVPAANHMVNVNKLAQMCKYLQFLLQCESEDKWFTYSGQDQNLNIVMGIDICICLGRRLL